MRHSDMILKHIFDVSASWRCLTTPLKPTETSFVLFQFCQCL